MSRIQTRRTVSVNRRVYDAGAEHAKRIGKPFSRLVEDLLLEAIGDAKLVGEIAKHRASEVQRTAPRQRPEPGPRGRPFGNRGRCSACGESGHSAGTDGLCSPTYLAAVDVIEHGESVINAARTHGVLPAGIYQRLASQRAKQSKAEAAK